MAVTADIVYKGVALTGIEFAVTRAEHIESADKSVLVYRCTVTMPDGSVQGDTGWETVSSDTPDFTLSPLADAEVQMVARLTAIGATNIKTVVE